MRVINENYENLTQLESLLKREAENDNKEDSAIKLLLIYLNSSLMDLALATKYSKEFHDKFPLNGAIFLLNVFSEYIRGGIGNSALEKIDNNRYPIEIKHLLYLVAILDLQDQNSSKAYNYAKLIPENNTDFVYLFRFFVRYYKSIRNKELCDKYRMLAVKGINYIFKDEDDFNSLQIDFFINERIKGTWLSKPNFGSLVEELIIG